jgi:hypothetical protein
MIRTKGELESTGQRSLRFNPTMRPIVLAMIEVERTWLEVEIALGCAIAHLPDVDIQITEKGQRIAERDVSGVVDQNLNC